MDKKSLQKRKYRVTANGVISDKQRVIPGVPQGIVLPSILCIIMIANIDENQKSSISRLFEDETKVSVKIRTYEDTELLQKYLN